MITTFNEFLEPSFELTREETEELKEKGFIETSDGYCITMKDNEVAIYKLYDDYEHLKLN